MTVTPLGRLICMRMTSLGIRSGQVAARLGYRNIAKGVRRFDEVCRGDLAGKEQLLAKLPGALNFPEDVVAAVIQENPERTRTGAAERTGARGGPVAGQVPSARGHNDRTRDTEPDLYRRHDRNRSIEARGHRCRSPSRRDSQTGPNGNSATTPAVARRDPHVREGHGLHHQAAPGRELQSRRRTHRETSESKKAG
jgi:hypothetical protein